MGWAATRRPDMPASRRHSGLDMTVLDWTNNGSESVARFILSRGHQRFYFFRYHGTAWDIDCGWGTTEPVSTAQASTAERACVAAVNSIEVT